MHTFKPPHHQQQQPKTCMCMYEVYMWISEQTRTKKMLAFHLLCSNLFRSIQLRFDRLVKRIELINVVHVFAEIVSYCVKLVCDFWISVFFCCFRALSLDSFVIIFDIRNSSNFTPICRLNIYIVWYTVSITQKLVFFVFFFFIYSNIVTILCCSNVFRSAFIVHDTQHRRMLK